MDQRDGKQEVVLTDVHIPFGSLVTLMVKVVIASIPAAIIVLILGFLAAGIFMKLLGK